MKQKLEYKKPEVKVIILKSEENLMGNPLFTEQQQGCNKIPPGQQS